MKRARIAYRGNRHLTVPTHLILGLKIHRAVSRSARVKIDKRWFLYGNVYPDFARNTLPDPHFAAVSMNYVLRRIEALCSHGVDGYFAGPVLSFQLGVLCHYVSDFFCHVHSRAFQGSMKAHLLYELRQQTAAMRHPRLIGRKNAFAAGAPLPADAQGIADALCRAQEAYLGAPHRIDTDLLLAVKVSVLIAASILRVCQHRAWEDGPEDILPPLISLQF